MEVVSFQYASQNKTLQTQILFDNHGCAVSWECEDEDHLSSTGEVKTTTTHHYHCHRPHHQWQRNDPHHHNHLHEFVLIL